MSPLKRYEFTKGDTFQIYTVKEGRLYKGVDLSGYTATLARASTFEKWIWPILHKINGVQFCLHLGDSPCDEIAEGMPNLCYCKKISDERDLRLIPDAYYQGHKGYINKKEYRLLYDVNWEEKAEKVIFRGGYTGEKPLGNNLRARLCSLDNPLVDAKLTGVNNEWEQNEIAHLLGEQMSRYQMAKYKYQVDIDGNTNSWDGFFWKLMSGSLTFKMSSEWRQWYYPQIQAGVHFVEFSGFDDLIQKVLYYKDNDNLALEIARNAQEFTRSFNYEDQYNVLIEAVKGKA